MRLLRYLVAPLARIAHRDQSRYAIYGVRVRRSAGSVEAVSSDGRRLLLVKTTDDPDVCDLSSGCQATLVAKALVEAERATRKAIPKHVPASAYLAIDEGSLNGTAQVCAGLEGSTCRFPVPCSERPFPSIDCVLGPAETEPYAARRHFNPRLLGELLLAVADALDEDEPCVSLDVREDKGSPIRITGNAGGVEVLALCMPMNVAAFEE